MTDLTRPIPDQPLAERVRTALSHLRDGRLGAGRDLVGSALVAMALVGAAVAVGAGLWGWQAWQGRSAPAIDDLLPTLVTETPAGVVGGTSAGVAAETPAGVVGGTSAGVAAEISEPEPVATDLDFADSDFADSPDGAPVLTTQPLIVHLSGAVASPGVVELKPDARVVDAVQAAGGLVSDADPDRINLAALVIDGARIHVPFVGDDSVPELVEPVTAGGPATTTTPTHERSSAPAVIDLNRAGVVELETLPGIGPTLAAQIVDLRDARGPYLSVDELLDVSGIGPATLAELRERVAVPPP